MKKSIEDFVKEGHSIAEATELFNKQTEETSFRVENGILFLPDYAEKIEASDIGGWFPDGPIGLSVPVWQGGYDRQKTRTKKDDIVVEYRLGQDDCKSYLSTLKGLFKALKKKHPSLTGGLLVNGGIRTDITLGYESQDNEQYPLRLVMGLR